MGQQTPPRKSMRARWTDPDQSGLSSARRTPRTVTGFRRFDPIRKLYARKTSGVTLEHIAAADKLRELVDISALGFTALRSLILTLQFRQPSAGLNRAALARNRAHRSLLRVLRRFRMNQLEMIDRIILSGMTLKQWVEASFDRDGPTEHAKLLAILDRLAEHFKSEIAQEIASGRRLKPQED